MVMILYSKKEFQVEKRTYKRSKEWHFMKSGCNGEKSMAKQKYYVVWEGKNPGIYDSWARCQIEIEGHQAAKYKSYGSLEEAKKVYNEGWKKHWGKDAKSKAKKKQPASSARESSIHEEIDYNSISVDVGTRGNPGPVEYKGVDTQTEEILFQVGPIEKGTNNLGEFIAIVHALAYLKQTGSNKTIYSDSLTAQKWVRTKQVATTLERDESTKKIWELTDRAVNWLNQNTYDNKILKWNTKEWGEIKADYGRK
jgi:ribonuclease HI